MFLFNKYGLTKFGRSPEGLVVHVVAACSWPWASPAGPEDTKAGQRNFSEIMLPLRAKQNRRDGGDWSGA
jgi:hypothetical protein